MGQLLLVPDVEFSSLVRIGGFVGCGDITGIAFGSIESRTGLICPASYLSPWSTAIRYASLASR